MSEELRWCKRCTYGVDSPCCTTDEVTGVCAGRCNVNGVHITDQPPVALKVDAEAVVKWLRKCDGRHGVSSVSTAWWQTQEADKAGLGALIDCMKQLEAE